MLHIIREGAGCFIPFLSFLSPCISHVRKRETLFMVLQFCLLSFGRCQQQVNNRRSVKCACMKRLRRVMYFVFSARSLFRPPSYNPTFQWSSLSGYYPVAFLWVPPFLTLPTCFIRLWPSSVMQAWMLLFTRSTCYFTHLFFCMSKSVVCPPSFLLPFNRCIILYLFCLCHSRAFL